MEECEARTGGFESANSLSERTKSAMQPNNSASTFVSVDSTNGPLGSVYMGEISPNGQQTFIRCTNSLEGALEDAKEHVAATTISPVIR